MKLSNVAVALLMLALAGCGGGDGGAAEPDRPSRERADFDRLRAAKDFDGACAALSAESRKIVVALRPGALYEASCEKALPEIPEVVIAPGEAALADDPKVVSLARSATACGKAARGVDANELTEATRSAVAGYFRKRAEQVRAIGRVLADARAPELREELRADAESAAAVAKEYERLAGDVADGDLGEALTTDQLANYPVGAVREGPGFVRLPCAGSVSPVLIGSPSNDRCLDLGAGDGDLSTAAAMVAGWRRSARGVRRVLRADKRLTRRRDVPLVRDLFRGLDEIDDELATAASSDEAVEAAMLKMFGLRDAMISLSLSSCGDVFFPAPLRVE